MNALRLTAWLLAGLGTCASTSCHHSDPEPLLNDQAQVSYAQTQCADPWGFTRDNQQLKTLATTYLAQQNIAFSATQATQTNAGAGVCAACTCPTGVVLTGTVPLSQLAAIQALGFKKL